MRRVPFSDSLGLVWLGWVFDTSLITMMGISDLIILIIFFFNFFFYYHHHQPLLSFLFLFTAAGSKISKGPGNVIDGMEGWLEIIIFSCVTVTARYLPSFEGILPLIFI